MVRRKLRGEAKRLAGQSLDSLAQYGVKSIRRGRTTIRKSGKDVIEERPRPKGYRTIEVDGVEWHWKFGRTYVNAICEDGRKARALPHEILGLSAQEWLDMTKKRRECLEDLCAHGYPPRNELLELTPRKVQEWIENLE